MSEEVLPQYDIAAEAERAEEHLHQLDPIHTWSRCDYCGRFIGLVEYDDGRAERIMVNHYDEIGEQVTEDYETHHVACIR